MMKVVILIPVYNDWQSVSKLIDEINNLSVSSEFQISVIIVNDASNHDRQEENKNLENINSIKILNMKTNQGHARCIATGLKYINEKEDFDKEIEFVTGNEWKAGNLSYHLKSRPKWEGFTNNKILNNSSQFICVDDVCLGRY